MLVLHVTERMAVVEVGQRIRHFRMQQGMTQEALARAAKLTAKFVSQIENGRVNPSIGVLARLVEALHLTFTAFFSWDPQDGDVATIIALVERQPVHFRRRLVRALEALCEEDARGWPGPSSRADTGAVTSRPRRS